VRPAADYGGPAGSCACAQAKSGQRHEMAVVKRNRQSSLYLILFGANRLGVGAIDPTGTG